MKVLACGGRYFTDRDAVFAALDALHGRRTITLLIEGGARGADTLAGEWADERAVPRQTFPADWDRLGRAAGPIRNQQMLDEDPDLVVAFPGTHGTEGMKRIARAAGVEAYEAVEGKLVRMV